jgi:hypothetical protein
MRPRVAFRRLTAAPSPISSLPRLFRGAHRLAGSGGVVAGIFAGSDGGFVFSLPVLRAGLFCFPNLQ